MRGCSGARWLPAGSRATARHGFVATGPPKPPGLERNLQRQPDSSRAFVGCVQTQHPKPLSQPKNKGKACCAASQQLIDSQTDLSAAVDGAGHGLGTVWTGGSQHPNFKPLLPKRRCKREWEGTRAAAWFLGSRSGCPRALSPPHRGRGAGEPRRGAPGGGNVPAWLLGEKGWCCQGVQQAWR